ncbi:hypothetical protein J4032_11810 [Streptomyces formicae]|uniref:Beta-galactosidase n=1 Tax=Streptomyces formicae TaxID=1616117 RepID=A0ABY3WHR9_9ACTN|nr:hypothetical protein [Streptomyces formicae]UNM12134.1 hypothetical protein J4032_11810 [Streptomyces formicae]
MAIEGVLAHQFTLPGHVAHGSWRRRPDEPDPAPDAADHAHDWCFAPCFALLAITPPAGVTARLTVFSGCRHVATTVTTAPRRVATSWIGERHLIGAQDSGGSLERWDDQYCPVAVHWQTPGTPHGVHWLRAAPGTPVDAAVDEEGTLRLTHYAHRNGEPLRFVVHAPQSAPQSAPDDVTAGHWRLPGLTVRVESAAGFDAVVSRSGDLLHIAYAPHEGAAEFLLRFTPV